MKSKAIACMALMLLLAAMLTTPFNVFLVEADSIPQPLEHHLTTRESGANNVSNLLDSQKSSPNGGEDYDLNPNAPAEHNPQPCSVDEDKWNLNMTNEWSNFANVDDDSAELVIGVNNAKPNSYTEIVRLIGENGGELVNTVSMGGKVWAVVADIPLVTVSSFVEEVQTTGLSRYIEPNMKFQANLVPDDPYWPSQWGPAKIEADYAWNTTIGDPSVLVAVIDTGIDWDHPDLAANYVALGYDWVHMDPDPLDDNGHGTHCAGIIAAVINNNIGIAGLAQVQVMAEKALDMYGGGWEDDLANAIIHAVDAGADILSNSWGGYGESALIHDAVEYAYDHDVLVVAAAGNEATDTKLYPAGYDQVVAVTATDRYDYPAWFTNFGDWVELAAPGVDIYSTVWDDGYAYMSGTSMSTPHVAGVAALVLSQFPDMTRDRLRLQLRYTADDLGDPGFDVYYGYGRINARKAVEEAPSDHDLLILNWEAPPYVKPGGAGTVRTTVFNFGASNESDITVQLLVNGSLVDSTFISFLASYTSTTVSCSWSPTVEEKYNVTSYVVPVPNETITENNFVWTYVYVGFVVKAVVLDSAGTDIPEIISTWQVLNTQWYVYGDTIIYIDYTSLNIDDITYDDIAATEADVLIISCASDPYSGWEFTDSEIDAIARYAHEGHGLIATSGTLYYYVPNNNKLAPLFGLDETIDWDIYFYTDLLHLQDPPHPLFLNVPNPYVFPQMPTTIPSDYHWDSNELVGGTYLALGHFAESAIVTYRGLVYISPLLEMIPPYYHFHLQLFYNAITWSRYQKPLHELIASLEAPQALEPSESTVLNATVSNIGLSNETNVELQLLIDGEEVDSSTISELWAGDSYTLSHLWTPTIEGVYNITAYVAPVPGEDNILNNVKSARVIVSALVVALFKNVDPWGYSSNEEALNLYGIPYVVFSSNDFGMVDLSAFTKVVIASDQNQNFYNAMNTYRWWFEDYVSNGGVLEIHAADRGWHDGGWVGVLPGGLQWVSYYGQYVTVVDPMHPVLSTPNAITEAELDEWNYAVHGYFSDYPADSRIVIIEDFTGMPAYLEFGYGAGFVVASSQTLEWAYMHSYSLILENSLLYAPVKYEHDLAVTLDAPLFLKPRGSSLLNATVHNRGLSNETDVDLFLLINGTTVNSTTISQLRTGESYTISYHWTPTAEATYNVTTYAPPVPGEGFTINNLATKFTIVRYAVFIGIIETHGETLHNEELANYYRSLGHIVEKVTTTITPEVLVNYDIIIVGEDWADTPWLPSEIAAVQAYIASGNGFIGIGDELAPSVQEIMGTYGIGYAGISGAAGSTSNFDPLHPIMQNVSLIYASYPIDSLRVAISAYYIVNDTYNEHILIAGAEVGGYVLCMSNDFAADPYADNNEIMFENIIDWMAVRYEHELVVALEAPTFLNPGDSSLLNATVYNRGLSNETDVELRLLINGSVVDSVEISELLTGSFYTFNYLWTTPTIEAMYNVTAYAPPVSGENVTINNFVSKMVRVRYVDVALISDYSELSAITSVLDSMGIGYDVYNDNRIHLYTTDLSLLHGYPLVIFYTDYRHITSDEHMTLETYLSLGGSLIVTGFDSLVSDDLLRDIIRSSTMGDNVGEPDLYVVEETHPIMNGPYGSFPAGHHISGLYSDCDAVEADIGRGAITIAELADGYDKIIATDLPEGKVIYWNGVGTNDWTYNSDCEAMFKNAVYWMTALYEHDLDVTLDAPHFLVPGSSTMLNASVSNLGLSNETNVELHLLINSEIVNSSVIPELLVQEVFTLSYLWTPTVEGTHNITAYATPVPGEQYTANNNLTIMVKVMTIEIPELPTDRPAVYVHPGIITANLGETFTISVVIFNLTDNWAEGSLGNLYGFDVQFSWDPTILEYIDHTVTVPVEDYPDPISPSPYPGILHADVMKLKEIVDEGGAIPGAEPGTMAWFCYCSLLPAPVFNGNGTVFTMTFRVAGEGMSTLHFVYTTLVDYYGMPILHASLDGLVIVGALPGIHDIAMLNVTAQPSAVYVGRVVNVTVVAKNNGTVNETFHLTLYYNTSIIETFRVSNLASGANITLTFSWDTTGMPPCTNYTIWAEASQVLGETNLDNNIFIGGYVKIKMLGDINGDGMVNLYDAVLLATAYGSRPGDPNWNPDADLAWPWNRIDIYDAVTLASRYGTCI